MSSDNHSNAVDDSPINNNHNNETDGVGGDSNRDADDAEIPLASHFMEGYTPLNFNMNNMMPMNDDSDDEDINNGVEEMNGEEFANNGYYHMLGAPPKRVNGVKDHAMGYSMGHDEEDNSANEDSESSFDNQNTTDATATPPSSSQQLHIPGDFQSLAEQALRGLEDEHRATLELSATQDIPVAATSVPPSSVSVDDTTTISNAPSSDAIIKIDEEEDTTTTHFETIFPPLEEAMMESTAATNNTTKSKPVNVNAIQKAMQSIRLKSPEFANTLDAGASSSFSPSSTALQASLGSVINFTCQNIQSMERQNTNHTIIPPGPLAAFRRSTPKARTASVNLSRSATLSDAVLRLWPLISFRRKMKLMGFGEKKSQSETQSSKTLIIHILGCDHVECSSEETLRKSVGPFARWLSAAIPSGILSTAQTSSIDSLVIEISGPNVPDWIVGREIDLLPSSTTAESIGGLVSAKAIFNQREYHEQSTDILAPDLAIAYNAGVWGYDSWKPTLSFMCHNSGSYDVTYACTPFVITAYTIEECEDDAEVISEVAEEAGAKRNMILAHQLWAPESNPFSSRIERQTVSVPGRKYFENSAWQAWLLGPTVPN